MFRSYLKSAIRNFIKRVNFSLINVSGLAVGLSAVLLITLYVEDELSYDTFHTDSENIYRIAWFSDEPQTRTPHPMALQMVEDLPEVESAVSLSPLWGPGLTRQTFALKNAESDVWFDEEDILSVDSTFFDVFSFELVKGNTETVLKNVGGLLLSESAVKKYFNEEDPIGKFIAINTEDLLLQVEGVFKDVPENSHFHFDFLVSYVTTKSFSDPESLYYTWSDFGHFNYIKLVPGTDVKGLQDKSLKWVGTYLDYTREDYERLEESGFGFKLQPIEDIHLKSNIRWELEPNGNIGYVYILTAAAILILVIATMNFMNLSTARSLERAKEIGVRKAVGADKKQLIAQFVGESFLLTLVAFILAVVIAELFLPSFNSFTNKNLSLFSESFIFNAIRVFFLFIMVGLISGIYPAFFLSRLQPGEVLKGNFNFTDSGLKTRKALVVAQYIISTFLIAASLIIFSQMNFIRSKNLGFDQENILVIPIKTNEIRERFETIKTDINGIGKIEYVTAVSNLPGTQFNQNPFYLENDPENSVGISEFMVDYDIFSTLGIDIIEGRGFSEENKIDQGQTFVINETAARALGIKDVGDVAVLDADGTFIEGEIIGIVKDFHFKSLHQPIRPILFMMRPGYNFTLVKLEDLSNLSNTIETISESWKKYDPNFEFEYFFLDNTIQQQYLKESKMGTIFSSFSILAIIVASIGLLGLASLNFVQKQKEVSIRKIMGASSVSLASGLVREFSILIAIALVVSIPITWIIMQNWLTNFSYRININPLIFLVAGTLIIIITYVTLSGLIIKTITKNPANTLRND